MTMKKTYKIEVECANCANKMELAAGRVAGVARVRVNYLLQKLEVEYAEGSEEKKVLADILRECRRIEPDCVIGQ